MLGEKARGTWFAAFAFATAVALAASCGRSGLHGIDGDFDLSSGDSGPGSGPGGNGGSGLSGPGPTTTTTTSTSTSTSTNTGGGGFGGMVECAGPNSCPDDGDPCTQAICVDGFCKTSLLDADGDGVPPLSCDPNGDCNDFNPNVYPGHPEVCDDAADNDCNGVADCFDPACANVPDCGCKPKPGGENCSNGKDDDCDTIVDCNDADCIGTPACGCAANETGKCVDGFDNDCDGAIDCDDFDCSADPSCQCQALFEDCGNQLDDDCDLLIDCADPDCQGVFPCTCQPPGSPEVCNDGLDNDCDKLVDCADPECLVSPACQNCVQEICNDGLDNNCDNKIDCADPSCAFAPNCAPKPEICNNGLDDDNDTLIDCQDPDCANNPNCVVEHANCLSPMLIPGTGTFTGDTTGHTSETKGQCGGDAGEAVFYFVLNEPSKVHLDSIGTSFDSTIYVRTGACNSGKEIGCDDDSGGSWAAKLEFGYECPDPSKKWAKPILYPGTYYVFLDGYTIDPQQGANEGPYVLNVQITPNPGEDCDNGCDDDGNIYADCADPACKLVGSCATCLLGGPAEPEFGTAACTDGLDNDCDGKIDCQDEDCSASDYYVTECCNGFDENGNGIIDDFNCRCNNDSECDFGQICYTHTAHVCGDPCELFFGDVCPFVAAGSFCNVATHQCEF